MMIWVCRCVSEVLYTGTEKTWSSIGHQKDTPHTVATTLTLGCHLQQAGCQCTANNTPGHKMMAEIYRHQAVAWRLAENNISWTIDHHIKWGLHTPPVYKFQESEPLHSLHPAVIFTVIPTLYANIIFNHYLHCTGDQLSRYSSHEIIAMINTRDAKLRYILYIVFVPKCSLKAMNI